MLRVRVCARTCDVHLSSVLALSREGCGSRSSRASHTTSKTQDFNKEELMLHRLLSCFSRSFTEDEDDWTDKRAQASYRLSNFFANALPSLGSSLASPDG